VAQTRAGYRRRPEGLERGRTMVVAAAWIYVADTSR
jgi:hypothetical protein